MLPYRLKELRKQKGITQEELSKHIGVQRAAVSKYESGMIVPSIEIVEKIAKYFNVSIDGLLGHNVDSDVYDKLNNILQERGISIHQLALDANIPPITLKSGFARKRNMSMEMLLKITTALQISINEIMDETDLWGIKARADIASESESFSLKQINSFLSDEEKAGLLGSLGTTLEYIYRYKSNPEAVERLSDIISLYGKMIIVSLEMRLGKVHQKDDYFLFLQHYERCMELIITHKRELLDATLNFRNGDTELLKLIHGEDESHE